MRCGWCLGSFTCMYSTCWHVCITYIYKYGTYKYFVKLIYHHGSCSLFARIFICFNLLHTSQRGWNMNQIWTPSNGIVDLAEEYRINWVKGPGLCQAMDLVWGNQIFALFHPNLSDVTWDASAGYEDPARISAMWDLSGFKLGKPRWTAGKLLFLSHKYQIEEYYNVEEYHLPLEKNNLKVL